MTAARIGTWGAIAGSAAVVIAPLGHRIGLLPLGPSFALLALGFLTLVVGALLLIVAALRRRIPPDTDRLAYGALAAAVLVSLFPLSALISGRAAPPIHDITTDTENPPAFVAAVALNEPGRTEYEGQVIAEQQQAAYPDIRPVTLPVDAGAAFDLALAAVEVLGWEVLETDAAAGRIEATDRTFWFGFADDVVIRITDTAGRRSRVDVRSLSRVGVGDLGANANRVRHFMAALTE
ncbi:MAG: DUF1499 domain-containing protein [Acidobacteria bacterium]|nr:DUF1499 domain-containing protein [Acidobacteriota bacterium]